MAHSISEIAATFSDLKIREHCKLCNVEYSSKEHKDDHIKGKKHLARHNEIRRCEYHNVVFTSKQESDKHFASKLHMPGEHQFECTLCKISCSSPDNLKDHQDGSSHQKKAHAMSFFCEYCYLQLHATDTILSHLEGKKHKSRQKDNTREKCDLCFQPRSEGHSLRCCKMPISDVVTVALTVKRSTAALAKARADKVRGTS